MEIALYQPEIPQNTGTIMRLGACLGAKVHIIEPCSFAFNDKKLERAGMDYIALSNYKRHISWESFCEAKGDNQRLVLMTPQARVTHIQFQFLPGDILLMGRESNGVPDSVTKMCDDQIKNSHDRWQTLP